MRKSLLKSVVAVAVVGATMAITSVAAMAATYVFDPTTQTTGDTGYDESTGVGDEEEEKAAPTFEAPFSGEGTVQKRSGTVKVNGTTYYKSNVTSVEIKKNKGGAIIVDAPANSVITATISSTGSSNSTSGAITDANGTELISSDVTGTLDSHGGVILKYEVTKAGKYKIVSTNSSRAVRVYQITLETSDDLTEGVFASGKNKIIVSSGNAYAVACIKKTDAFDTTESVTVTIGDQTFTTDTVYKAISVNGTEYNASDLGTNYVYAVEITGVQNDANVAKIKGFTVA